VTSSNSSSSSVVCPLLGFSALMSKESVLNPLLVDVDGSLEKCALWHQC
jgi:hypothetical protein